MKHLGIVPILLLMGLWIISGPSMAELTATQQINPPQAAVGETVMVTVMLTYNGANAMQTMVTPNPPFGIVSDYSGDLSADLYPGVTEPISYPIRAEQSGTYWIASQIAYSEGGRNLNLRLETPFTAIGSAAPEPRPQPTTPDAATGGSPGEVTPSGEFPGGAVPGEMPPGGGFPGGAVPGEVTPGGEFPGGAVPGEVTPGGEFPGGAGNSS
jgi:uncharacterized protein (DUF58 family)